MASQPWMKFFGADWFSSERVIGLSIHGREAFLRMLWLQHERGSCPDDYAMVARLTQGVAEEVYQGWAEARAMFSVGEDGRLRNLEYPKKTRRSDAQVSASRRNGKAGGRPPGSKSGPETQETQQKPVERNLGKTRETRLDKEKEVDNTPPPPRGRTWETVLGELKGAMPESHHAALVLYCQHRRELGRGKPYTTVSASQFADRYSSWPAARFEAAVRHTVSQGWQGIFEPSQAGGAGHQPVVLARRERRPEEMP